MSGRRGSGPSKNKDVGCWKAEDIKWGLEIARTLDVGIEDDDYWPDEDDDGEDWAGEEDTSEQDRLQEETEQANLLHGMLTVALRNLVPEHAAPEQGVPGATPEDVAGVIGGAADLAGRILTADLSSLQAMDKDLV